MGIFIVSNITNNFRKVKYFITIHYSSVLNSAIIPIHQIIFCNLVAN